jgi:hypothetical protein
LRKGSIVAGEALEQMCREFEAFLADPESYDRHRHRRDLGERVDLVKACIEDVYRLEKERVALANAVSAIRTVTVAVTEGLVLPGASGAN